MPPTDYLLFGRGKYKPIYISAGAGRELSGRMELFIKGKDLFAMLMCDEGPVRLHKIAGSTAKQLNCKLLDEILCAVFPKLRGKPIPTWYDPAHRALLLGSIRHYGCSFDPARFDHIDVAGFHRINACFKGYNLVLSRKLPQRFDILAQDDVILLRYNRNGAFAQKIVKGSHRVSEPELYPLCRKLWGKRLNIVARRTEQGVALSSDISQLLFIDGLWETALPIERRSSQPEPSLAKPRGHIIT